MANEMFRVTQEGKASVVELLLPEHLDSREFDQLNEALLAALAAHPAGNWVIDLAGVSYMGSSALGLMVNVRQRVKLAGGRLALCGMSPALMRVFTTCCLEKLFIIRTGRPEAVRAVA